MKKIALLLVFSALISTVSCQNGQTPAADDSGTVSDSDTSAVETKSIYDPELPEPDFDGCEFVFAVRGEEGVEDLYWSGTDIVADEQNGDVLNDAIYERNAYMKDTDNVDIKALFCGNTSTSISGSDVEFCREIDHERR